MSEVACLSTVPMKMSSELDFSRKIVQFGKLKKWDVGILDKMTKKRNTLLKAFAEKQQVDKTVEEYLAYLVAMTEGGRAGFLRKVLYYYWSTAVGKRTSHAAADAHYEMASVLSNWGIYEMGEVAQSVHLSNRSSAERVEKDGYKTLCAAAGRFEKSRELMASFPTVDDAFPLDIKPVMLSGFRDLCLAQAQELSLSKALRNPDNRGRELLSKLASRSYELYTAALKSFQDSKGPLEEPLYASLVAWTSIKKLSLHIRTFLLMTAHYSSAKVNKMPEAVSAAKQAEDLMAKLNAELSLHKKQLDKPLIVSIELLGQECQRMSYKVKRDIDIIGRPKPLESHVPLADPQELARPTPYSYPEMSLDWTPNVIQIFELKE
eukprot:TRINITY_DN9995_c0_g1_i3.p1 TRINITY_DN9995_c0_g1~~TRINITY_DN9995_c0_g1_i3.p1  ORF type:complete len:392 (+),score=109.06 TRINITY_DN9995_c0_g1_i3:46-1176(+)